VFGFPKKIFHFAGLTGVCDEASQVFEGHRPKGVWQALFDLWKNPPDCPCCRPR